MNQTLLSKPPADADDYVQPPDYCCTPEAVEDWLREMLQEAKLNLHIPDCFIQTVANVSSEATKARYRIQFLPIAASTATADFFLERLP